MRVVVLSQYYYPETAVPIPLDVARHLRLAGHHVSVLTGIPNYPSGTRFPGYSRRRSVRPGPAGETVTRLPEYCYYGPSAAKRAANYGSFVLSATFQGQAALRQADVVYVYGSPVTAGIPAAVARSKGGAPYVVHAQDIWPDAVGATGFLNRSGSLAYRLASAAADLVYGRASSIIAISDGACRELAQRPALRNTPIATVRNWANEERASAIAATPPASGPLRVMYAGNIGAAQGLHVLVDAASALRKQGVEMRFDVVGTGTEEAALRAAVRDRGLSNFYLHGRVEPTEMDRLYEHSDLHLVPLAPRSELESTIPGKTQQLLYAGLPILCVASGDVAELVGAARAGYCTAPGDVEGLVATLRQALDDRAKLPELGANGRDYYMRWLSRDRGVSEIEEMLGSVATAE